MVVFASQAEFAIDQFIRWYFPQIAEEPQEPRIFDWYLERVQFWQVLRAVRVISEEESGKETAQSVNFYFDILKDVFATVSAKFGAPAGHLLLSSFDQDLITKFGNISQGNKPLRLRFSERLLGFLDEVLSNLTLKQRDEVISTLLRNMNAERGSNKQG